MPFARVFMARTALYRLDASFLSARQICLEVQIERLIRRAVVDVLFDFKKWRGYAHKFLACIEVLQGDQGG